jgi:hypothetical protein
MTPHVCMHARPQMGARRMTLNSGLQGRATIGETRDRHQVLNISAACRDPIDSHGSFQGWSSGLRTMIPLCFAMIVDAFTSATSFLAQSLSLP